MIECEVYSRCSGYFRPVKQWNNGKKEEFTQRRGLKYEQSADVTAKVVETSLRN